MLHSSFLIFAVVFFVIDAMAWTSPTGGILSGPMMLRMGVEPAVAASTSSFMLLFTASSSTLQYGLLGRLSPSYAVYYALVAWAGALMGQLVVCHLLKRLHRQSFIVFLLATVSICSGIAIIIVEVVTGEPTNMTFRPDDVCD